MNATLLGFMALALVGGSAALWFRRAHAVALPADRRGFLAVWLLGAGLGVAALASGAGWLGGVAAGLAVFVAAFLCFTVSISRQVVDEAAIRVGGSIPDASALDEQRAVVSLASFRGQPLLLKFFRGHW